MVSQKPPSSFLMFLAHLIIHPMLSSDEGQLSIASDWARVYPMQALPQRGRRRGSAGRSARNAARRAVGRASMTTKAWARGGSSVRETWTTASWPCGRHGPQALQRPAGEPQGRPPAGQVHHLHVAPEHAAAQPGAERLGAGLLGGEAPRVGGRAGRAAVAARALAHREDAMGEAVAEALERALDPADVAEVRADAEDHRRQSLPASTNAVASAPGPRPWPRASRGPPRRGP